MTLVEVLMAVAIIGLLAALMVPAYRMAIRHRQNAQTASRLRQAVTVFTLYRSENGRYPADRTPAVIPPEMTDYFAQFDIDDWWTQVTALGGRWDWDNGYNFKYSVSISTPTKPQSQLIEYDRLIDDGDLNTGKFRKVGVQYHYILEE
jgi:type II secretory pathway pseudopilin PulG